jgi:DHA2 family multidrug resistance protein-like MFS transporter
VMAGVSLMSTQYLQLVRALSPLDSGLWLLPQNVAMVAGSLLAPMLARRIQPAYVIALGLAIAGLGVALHTAVDPVTGLPLLVAGLVLAAFGISLPMAVTMNLMMGATPPEKAGSAASISETSGEFGIAMGIATLGTLGTVVYRASLPSGTTGPARESLSSAVATGGPVVDAARDAFTVGLHAVGAVGAVIFLGLAVVSALTLRSREPKAPAELAVAH